MSYSARVYLMAVIAIALFKLICGVHKPNTHHVENKVVHSAPHH